MQQSRQGDLTEDKKIVVLPTKTIPQGISAMIGYMPEASVDENAENMKDACQDIASGQVTYAVRDTSIDGKRFIMAISWELMMTESQP